MAFFSRTFIATAVAAALAFPVLAQQAASDAAAPAAAATQVETQAQTSAQVRTPMNAERRAKHMEQRRAKMQDRMAQHQAQLKQKLELSAEQEPAWNAFVARMKMEKTGERPARAGHQNRADMQKMTTPERIERMRALRAERHAEADKRADAALAFYAALNPAQQMTFDAHTMRYQHHFDGQSGGQSGHKKGHKNW